MSTTINIRNVPDELAARVRRAAGSREMTMVDYLAALVDFHDAARARADAGGADWQAELEARGLETRRV